jgi:hypothetical protein
MPIEVPDDLIDCEDFVYRVVTIAPYSISMNKDARVVFSFGKGQERAIGEALDAFSKIKELGVSKPSLLGAALTKMYTTVLIESVNDIAFNDPVTSNLMFEKRSKEVAKKKGFESSDA